MQNVLVVSYLRRKDYCHNNLCVGIVSLYKYNVYILFLYKMERELVIEPMFEKFGLNTIKKCTES